jgi:hypothetical protein
VRGFGSDISAVAGTGSTICDLAADLRTDARAWSNAEEGEPNAFGVVELTGGLAAVHDAWRDEFNVYVDVLSRWCAAIAQSADNYQSADAAAAARMSPEPMRAVRSAR